MARASSESQERKSKKINTTDQIGTSSQEQAIYFNVKQFFDDAESRAQIVSTGGKTAEIDVYIPSLRVAIEYDGKYWHSRKIKQDNSKNIILNDLGIFVIRVRDVGLPELDAFHGVVLMHGKPPEGEYITTIIENIIHILALFTTKDKRGTLINFQLTYEDYLYQRPSIEALLFKEEKEVNFTQHSAFKYWDYELNRELNPNNLEMTSNAFAWFICPKGDRIIRIIQQLVNVHDLCCNNGSLQKYCVYSLCPFLPQDGYLAHGRNCGKSCTYVEPLFIDLIRSFVQDGAPIEKFELQTCQEIKAYPRVAYEIIRQITITEGNVKSNLEALFLHKEKDGNALFVSRSVRLDSIDEIDVVLQFNKMYPNTFVSFNWGVFDKTTTGRNKLIEYFTELTKTKEFASLILLNYFIRERIDDVSTTLQNMIFSFANKNRIFLLDNIFDTNLMYGDK